MARPLRIEFAGASYHVTSRGNERQQIYFTDDDRSAFLEVLGEGVARFGWLCHAYCLMTNHYHLLVEAPQANLSQGMRQLNGAYSMQAIADHFGVGRMTVSRAVKNHPPA